MFHKSFRKYFVVALALLLCQPMASAKTQMGKPHHTVYAMSVDYNPKTEQLTGLCQVNGHTCWLLGASPGAPYFGTFSSTSRQRRCCDRTL